MKTWVSFLFLIMGIGFCGAMEKKNDNTRKFSCMAKEENNKKSTAKKPVEEFVTVNKGNQPEAIELDLLDSKIKREDLEKIREVLVGAKNVQVLDMGIYLSGVQIDYNCIDEAIELLDFEISCYCQQIDLDDIEIINCD